MTRQSSIAGVEQLMDTKKLTFMAACRDFFGMHPNQKPIEFGKEVKDLNEADRAEITAGLEKLGYEILSAPGVPA